VEALADDLRRHLRHEPVTARPDTLTYRASKFVRRHPAAVVSATVALVAAGAFTAAIARQSREARLQRDEAKAQMTRATAAREFMGFLLSVASSPGSTHTSGDLLEKGEALIGKELREERAAAGGDARVHRPAVHRLGALREATPLLERAAALAGRSGDPALQARALCPLAILAHDQEPAGRSERAHGTRAGTPPDDSLHAMQRVECLIDRGSFGFLTGEAEPMKRDGAAALAILDTIPVPPPRNASTPLRCSRTATTWPARAAKPTRPTSS